MTERKARSKEEKPPKASGRARSTKSQGGVGRQAPEGTHEPATRRAVERNPEELEVLIARRAYEIYEYRTTRGPLDDWLEAEREILSRREPT
ncbi:hypothetical protein [Candidatus Nitrospira bockiana]